MSDLYNPGKDIIDAYLKGVSIKNQREAHQKQAQLEALKLEQDFKTAQERNKETTRYHDLLDAHNQATEKTAQLANKLKAHESIVSTARAIQDGLLKIKDPTLGWLGEGNSINFENLEPTEKGTAVKVKAETAGAIEQAKNPPLIERAGGISAAQQPFALERIDAQNKGAASRQLSGQLFQSVENEKNRQAAKENTLIRAQATLANKAATKEEKAQVVNDAIDAYKDDIFTGRLPVDNQAFPKGDAGLRIQTAMRANGVRMLNQKEADKLTGLRTLDGFINKLGDLNSLLQEGGIVGQATNPKIKQLQQELEADLVLFGREAKGEKGVVTDKDIDRLKGAIPQILPGGIVSIRDQEGRKAANSRRVKQAIDVYHEKFDSILGEKISPLQKEAIRKEFGIRERDLPDDLKEKK